MWRWGPISAARGEIPRCQPGPVRHLPCNDAVMHPTRSVTVSTRTRAENRRRAKRVPVRIAATLRHVGTSSEVLVTDASLWGLAVLLDLGGPTRGDRVTLEICDGDRVHLVGGRIVRESFLGAGRKAVGIDLLTKDAAFGEWVAAQAITVMEACHHARRNHWEAASRALLRVGFDESHRTALYAVSYAVGSGLT